VILFPEESKFDCHPVRRSFGRRVSQRGLQTGCVKAGGLEIVVGRVPSRGGVCVGRVPSRGGD